MEIKSASCLLLIRDSGSVALQKFTTTYFPLSISRLGVSELEERVRRGASSPICNEWPKGIEDDKNAAKANEKNKYLVFTISSFRFVTH